jgi:hypothetical protein
MPRSGQCGSRAELGFVLVCVGVLAAVQAAAVDCDVHRYRHLCRDFPGFEEWVTMPGGGYPPQDVGWSVCVDETGQARHGPGGCDPFVPRPIEIGRCEPSAYYYEKTHGSETYRAATLYSFVLNPAVCTPCAHEVLSAIQTCKHVCGEIFGHLGFDGQGFVPMEPTDPRSLRTFRLTRRRSHRGKTAHELCLDTCGPPNGAGATLPLGAVKPPPEQRRNHWYLVTYGRRWNPNTSLGFWLRSYAVNPDKRTSPAAVCVRAMSDYCLELHRAEPGSAALQAACRVAGRGSGRTDIGLCEAFRRAGFVCDGTCYSDGGDAYTNESHVCGPARKCSGVTATCGWDFETDPGG